MKRTMRRKSEPFIKMLKNNVVACRKSPTKVCNFVPFAQGYEARDVQELSSEVREQARAQGISPSSAAARPRMWALCKALAFFMTGDAVKVLKVPPVPWTANYGRQLEKRLLAARQKNIQVMNCRFQHCSRRSVLGVSAQHAKPMITDLVNLVEGCVAAVAAMKKNRGETPICPTQYYQELASGGQPAIGYVQKLAVVMARAAGLKDLRELDDATLVEIHSCDSGCARGMQKITGDTEAQLKNKAFLRLRLITLLEVIEREWRKTKPRVTMEQGGRTESEKAEALATQLCLWAKGDFSEEVHYR